MLFSKEPKENVADLFDRNDERGQLEQALRLKERLNVVYGMRRTGKTSLIRSVLNEREWPYVFIDVRELYLRYNSVPMEAMEELVASGFAAFLEKVGKTAGDLRGQTNGFGQPGLTGLLKGIDEWCKGEKLCFVIALDEAQYLRFSGSVKYDMLLAWSADNLSSVLYVISGSEVGVLDDFLKFWDKKAPLYGRFKNEIRLARFSREKGVGFLRKGFEELGKKVDAAELGRAVDRIDGIVGWLSYYGYYRGVKKLEEEAALEAVFKDGCALVRSELDNLTKFSNKRYLTILKAVASGQTKWSDIKPYVIAKSGKKITDSMLGALLQNLVNFGILEKDELHKEYSIPDPLVTYSVKKAR